MPIVFEEENLVEMQGFSVRSVTMDTERKSVKIVLNSRSDSSSGDRAMGFSHIKVTIRMKNLDEAQAYYHDQAQMEWERFWDFLYPRLIKKVQEMLSKDGHFCIRESTDDLNRVFKLEGFFWLENPGALGGEEEAPCLVVTLLGKKMASLATFAIMTALRFLTESEN